MDRFINNFLKNSADGIIIEIGCRLETTYFSYKNNNNQWYVDLPKVINFREKVIPKGENQILIKEDILKTDWTDNIKEEINNKPILIIAGGLFYYLKKEDVLKSIRNFLRL